jgi:hypothetical protein
MKTAAERKFGRRSTRRLASAAVLNRLKSGPHLRLQNELLLLFARLSRQRMRTDASRQWFSAIATAIHDAAAWLRLSGWRRKDLSRHPVPASQSA